MLNPVAPTQAIAKNDQILTIAAGEIPYVFHPVKKGPYNQVFEQLVANMPVNVRLKYYPLKRAMKRMATQDYDCFAMALKDSPNWAKLGIDPSFFQFVGPINTINIKVYLAAGQSMETLEQLSGSMVTADSSIINLHSQFSSFEQRVNLVGTDSYVVALEQLVSGRAAAALAYDADVAMLGADHPLKGAVVDTGIVLASFQDGIICKDTERLEPIISAMQAKIDAMRDSGTLTELLQSQ